MKVLFLLLLSTIGTTFGYKLNEYRHRNRAWTEGNLPDTNNQCSICTCELGSNIINCIDINLTEMLTNDEWIQLNTTNTSRDIVRFDNNQIRIIPAFPQLQMRVLSLKNNRIQIIEIGAFKELTLLEELDLSGNELTRMSVNQQVFQGRYNPSQYEPMKNLKKLYLGNNLIESLDGNVFENLPNVETLSLDRNQMTLGKPPTSAIRSLANLQYLDLSYMQLSYLPPYLFENLPYLVGLDLTGNQFNQVPAKGLRTATNLVYLTLDDNPISEFHAHSFPYFWNLQDLSISNMSHLQHIGEYAFAALDSLKKLKCQDNSKLSYIDPLSLARYSYSPSIKSRLDLEELMLSNNKLTTLDTYLVENWSNLDFIDIRFNPWDCTCENQWMVTGLLSIIKDKSPHFSYPIRCATPRRLEGYEMQSLYEMGITLKCKHHKLPFMIAAAVVTGLMIISLIYVTVLCIWKRGCCGLRNYLFAGTAKQPLLTKA